MAKVALITGITGQDGSYLAELLLSKGYEVHGITRRTSKPLHDNIAHILERVTLHPADMTDAGSLHQAIEKSMPDEIYNLAGMSQVRWSYDVPAMTMDVNCNGFLRIIESVRQLKLDAKIYQACSSEMFGKVQEVPQTEKTPFYPRSPYGVSKAAAYYMARVYRESYGMKIYCGILFNHESERRGEEFLSRKVCKAVAEIAAGFRSKLVLGNLDAKRDFGYAREYVEWIWNIVQHTIPDDFVIATGETHSVKEFVELAFKYAGIDNWEDYVDYDKSLTRPAEVDLLIGNATKSKEVLGFEPKIKFNDLVKIMMDHELHSIGGQPPHTVRMDNRPEIQVS
jgi:GDPmannose 4,6-dehydratase